MGGGGGGHESVDVCVTSHMRCEYLYESEWYVCVRSMYLDAQEHGPDQKGLRKEGCALLCEYLYESEWCVCVC